MNREPDKPQKETKACNNPFYVLATVAGEQRKEKIDEDLHAKNRRYWNGYVCRNLSQENRKALAEQLGVVVSDLNPLTKEEIAAVNKAFENKFGGPGRIPYTGQGEKIDLSEASFKSVCFKGFVFPENTSFANSEFAEFCDFGKAGFRGDVQFYNTHFMKGANFESSVFIGFAYFGQSRFAANPADKICANFQSARFSSNAYFDAATFSSKADFRKATFCNQTLFVNTQFGDVDFSLAEFAEDVDYSLDCTIHKSADFSRSTFRGSVEFVETVFGSGASFSQATFHGEADFSKARFSSELIEVDFFGVQFSREAKFVSSEFSNTVWFNNCVFKHIGNFTNVKFLCPARFESAKFAGMGELGLMNLESGVPAFYGAEFRQDTRFSTDPENWPRIAKEDAADGKEAYTCLRQAMSDLRKVDEEQFFHRQEMQCKEKLEDGFNSALTRLYGALSDYGHSVRKPAEILFGIWFVPVIIYSGTFAAMRYLQLPPYHSWYEAFTFSFASEFQFFGFQRIFFGTEYLNKLPKLLQFLSGMQMILGIFFFFLLGLGVRTRFRLR